MRTKEEILQEVRESGFGVTHEIALIEVLIDIRDLLTPPTNEGLYRAMTGMTPEEMNAFTDRLNEVLDKAHHEHR